MPTVTVCFREFKYSVYHRGAALARPSLSCIAHYEPGMLSVSRSPLAWTQIAQLNVQHPIYELQRNDSHPARFVDYEHTKPGVAAILAWTIAQGYLDVNGKDTAALHSALRIGGLDTDIGSRVVDEAAYIAWALKHLSGKHDVDGVWFSTPASGHYPNITRVGIFFDRLGLFTATNVASTFTNDPNTLPTVSPGKLVTF